MPTEHDLTAENATDPRDDEVLTMTRHQLRILTKTLLDDYVRLERIL